MEEKFLSKLPTEEKQERKKKRQRTLKRNRSKLDHRGGKRSVGEAEISTRGGGLSKFRAGGNAAGNNGKAKRKRRKKKKTYVMLAIGKSDGIHSIY